MNQALESRETPLVAARMQARQGRQSLVHAIVGWGLFLGSFAMFLGISDGRGDAELALLNLVPFLSASFPRR